MNFRSTWQGQGGFGGFLPGMKEADSNCIAAASKAEIAYHLATGADQANTDQIVAASIGTNSAHFISNTGDSLLTWMTELGTGSSDLNGDGAVDSGDSSFVTRRMEHELIKKHGTFTGRTTWRGNRQRGISYRSRTKYYPKGDYPCL